MIRNKKAYIAEILLENKLITPQQLETALEKQKTSDKKIGQILVELGYVEEITLLKLLAKQLHIPYVNLQEFPVEPDLVKLLPEFYARHFRAIILQMEEDAYLVGMVDPQNIIALDEIQHILKKKIHPALIREEDLLYILDNIYRRSDEILQFAENLSSELKPSEITLFTDTQDLSADDIPVVNLLRSIFEDAVQINASDIHIEPDDSVLRIRLRVDGVLQEQVLHEKSIAEALTQRIKLVSNLNIAEKRLPQDGRFTTKIKNKTIDVRVSTLPVQFGESLVMRLLIQSAAMLNLAKIDMPDALLHAYSQILYASYGLLLMVGPTGSGKTTTLYASLNQLNKPDDKIITVEDPVEYRLPRINQVQVNTKIDLTFANILRSILRQDPDTIMIGELRDKETMEIALRAAMTGHFVLSTLHTNDTISCATRLLDMGAPGYLVASVLRAILAQRLVRRICEKCSISDALTDAERAWLIAIDSELASNANFKRGIGCTYCHQTGYLGRIAVFELLLMSPELIDALRLENTGEFYRLAKLQPLYKPLVLSGLELAARGITSVQEIIRMAGET